MSKFCKSCGALLNPDIKFCSSCGIIVQTPECTAAHGRGRAEEKIKTAESALTKKGSIDYGRYGANQSRELPSLFAFIKKSIRDGLASLQQLLKTPKRLIPMLVLGVFWLILSILPALGINPLPVRLLSFLTFAQGGMYGGVWGAVGGVLGKAVFAYFVSALILPLFSGKNPFKGMVKGLKGFASGLVVQSVAAASQLILGIGLALVVFNFLTGNASAVNSMAGVVGFVLAVKALWTRGGFFWSLLLSVAHSLSRGRSPSQMTIGRVMSGYAAGSAAGIALSALRLPYLPYALGVLLIIAGVILGIAGKSKKEVTAV